MSSFLGDFAAQVGALLAIDGFQLVQNRAIFGREGFDRETEQGPFVQVLPDPAGDAYESTTGSNPPATTIIRYVGVLVHFQASSVKPSPTEDDHVEAIDALTDAFVFHTIALCHGVSPVTGKPRGLRVRGMKSAPVSVNELASQTVAKTSMQFQIGRGVNRPNPKLSNAVAPPTPKQQIIARGQSNVESSEKVLASGTTATIASFAGPDAATIAGLAGVDPTWRGLDLLLSGTANPNNAGRFRIRSVTDAAHVVAINSAAVAPDANNGAIVWSIVRSETAVPGVT